MGQFALVIDDAPVSGDTYTYGGCCRGDADRHTCFGACGCSAAHITAGTTADTDTELQIPTPSAFAPVGKRGIGCSRQ